MGRASPMDRHRAAASRARGVSSRWAGGSRCCLQRVGVGISRGGEMKRVKGQHEERGCGTLCHGAATKRA